MKYQDMKIRDVGRMALLGLACAAVVAIGVVARDSVEPVLERRFMPIVWGIGVVAPLAFAMCVLYLLSTPAQNASFIRWAQKHLPRQVPPDFDWSLLDANDPDYRVTTLRYLLRRPLRRRAAAEE